MCVSRLDCPVCLATQLYATDSHVAIPWNPSALLQQNIPISRKQILAVYFKIILIELMYIVFVSFDWTRALSPVCFGFVHNSMNCFAFLIRL
jgi:hypothetical protein